MQGQNFIANLKVLILEGCDLVLGLDWMEVGEVTIHIGEDSLVLKAQKEDKSFQLLKCKRIHKFFKNGTKGITGYLFMMTEVNYSNAKGIHKFLKNGIKGMIGDLFMMTKVKE